MSTTVLNYKQLPIAERIQLVEDIWDSIAEETPNGLQLSAGELAELNRRMAEHVANPASAIPWNQVKSILFKG
jgi:putative addiction module component (TIGR02574 family)